MVRVDEGWEVLLVEDIIRDSGSIKTLQDVVACNCIMVTSPTTARLCRDGFCVDLAIGVGSLICPPGCGASEWRLSQPIWCYGVRIGAGKCTCIGSCVKHVRYMLGSEGETASVSTLHELLSGLEAGQRMLVVLPETRFLDVEVSGGFCGRLSSVNPLHPGGVVGKPGFDSCIGEYAYPVGPASRLLLPVLKLRGRPVLWSYEGLGEAVVLGFNPERASGAVVLAALMAALYICGEKLS